MPIVNLSPWDVPYLSVAVDVLTRDGAPNEKTYDVDGMRRHLMSKVAADTRYQGVLEYFESRADYDFTIKGRDDIDVDDLRTYVEQLLFSYMTYDEGGRRQYKALNEREMYSYLDEEGDTILESEFAVEVKPYTREDIATWRKELPYLLKRLTDFGRRNGILMMSAIVARQRCVKENENIKPANLLKHMIIQIDMSGKIVGVVTENLGNFQAFFHNWLRGDDGYRDAYYNDLMKFITICDRLGIDLTMENPLNYLCTHVDNMVCDYIIANRDLMMNAASNLSPNLQAPALEYISKLSIDDLSALPKIVKDLSVSTGTATTHYDLIQWAKQKFIDCGEAQKTSRFVTDALLKALLIEYLTVNEDAAINFEYRKLQVDNGFYMYRNAPVLIKLFKLYEKVPGYGTDALIHNKGFLVLVPARERKDIAYMPIEQAIYTYKQISRGGGFGRNIWSTI